MIGIGLHVTHKGFKIAIVDRIEDRYIIKKVLHSNFEDEIINNGTIELKDQFISSLGKFVASNSLIKKRVSINYFNQKINFRTFSIPIMAEKDLKKAVQWQIAEDLTMSLDELVYDYSVVGISEEKYDILAIVAKKEDISQYITLIMEAGLNVGVIDLTNSASIYPMSHDFFVKEGYSVLLDISYDSSNITFLKNDNISFVRSINTGLKRLIDTLVKETPYKFDEIIKDPQLLEKNFVHFEDFYAAISGEFQNSIWFYESNYIKNRSVGTVNLKNIILNQYATKLPEFKSYLHNIPVFSESLITEWKPNTELFESTLKEQDWKKYNISIGLAMRSTEND